VRQHQVRQPDVLCESRHLGGGAVAELAAGRGGRRLGVGRLVHQHLGGPAGVGEQFRTVVVAADDDASRAATEVEIRLAA